DTYGFPIDLTIEMARERGFSVDLVGFEQAMAAQRAASRGGAAFKDEARGRAELYVSAAGGKTEFLGYDTTESDATVVAIFGPAGALDEAEAGQPVEIILNRTPFYGESGGQIGDTGLIRTETGLIDIDETVKPTPDIFVHRGTVAEGFIKVGETATAKVDAFRRRAIRRNHTATHLLHRALRIVLGEETHQAGSLVAPDRLRFDFTSLDAMTPAQVARVAEIVNREILNDTPVTATVRTFKEAVAEGAMALFGEKYGDVVRMVSVEGFSKELCGGIHVSHTGEIGPFMIVSEGSVAAGIRRIEALTGDAAVERMLTQHRLLEDLGRELRTPWHELPVQIAALQERVRQSEREVSRLRGQIAGARAGNLIEQAIAVDGTRVLAARVEVDSKDGLRQMGDRLRDQIGSGVIVLGTVVDGQPSLLSMVTPDIVARGVKAGDLVRQAAAMIDGRGGGRPELAEAGGKNAGKLDEAIAAIPGFVKSGLGG
ncbi:MAG: alanine--tRNA ligase, partial [Thermomicrobiales bacterium]|nr:alanine--tRNA ligase [Thermomicrobiales bacterium]